MTARHLLDALRSVSEPPCVTHACSQRDRCAAEELACSAFEFYVKTGTALHPNMEVRIPASGFGNSRKVYGDSPKPTRERFLAMDAEPLGPDSDVNPGEVLEARAAERQLEHWWFVDVERAERTLQRLAKELAKDEAAG